MAKQGACPESIWPYDDSPFPPNPKLTQKPPKGCYNEAAKHKAIEYQRLVQNTNQMKGCLACGYPFAFGFTVYYSFESPEVKKTDHAPMPGPNEQVLGGHAVLRLATTNQSNGLL